MKTKARWLGVVLFAGLGGLALAQAPDDPETYLTKEEMKQMDEFDLHAIGQADKFFAKKEYKQAEVEYDSFVVTHPKSKAVPYALLRKGRSRQLVDKRFEAIKIYTEVLDYFPDNIVYAGASLYYIGLCHQENGNPVEAMKAFTEMAQDKDYRQHRLAAPAIMMLADYMVKQDKAEDAAKYYEQVAVDFRTRMPTTAMEAIRQAVYHHIRRARNEKKVRDFYIKVSGFSHQQLSAQQIAKMEKLLEDRTFAEQTRGFIQQYGGFDEKAVSERKEYFTYWAGVFENKFPDWDDFQVQIFGWSGDKWVEKADAQFRRVKPSFERIIWWMQRCWGRDNPQKVVEYYSLIDFPKMDNGKYFTLMQTLYDNCNQIPMALAQLDRMDFAKMSEGEKEGLFGFFAQRRQEGPMLKVLARIKDQDRADYLLLTYFVGLGDVARGIPQAEKVEKVPQYASYAVWEKSGLLMKARRFEEAIATCRQITDRGAAAPYRIHECYVALGKIDLAVQELRGIENFFREESSKACLMVACLYKAVGRDKECAMVLREVGHKYPSSPQASVAHEMLEKMGFTKTFDGEDAKKD